LLECENAPRSLLRCEPIFVQIAQEFAPPRVVKHPSSH
jgi:hypothetical protein